MNTVAVRPVEPKIVKSLFNRHLEELAHTWGWREFKNLRESFLQKPAGHEGPDTRPADYKAEVERIATLIRKEAFDRMIASLAKQAHTEDLDVLWSMTRKAGFRVKLGDIYVAEGPLSMLPTVFDPAAFELWP